MEGLYRSPLRVYLALIVLSLIGIWSAFRLPVSLFPNSSKPFVGLCINTDLAPAAFLRGYGESIEEQLRSIKRGNLQVEKLVARYTANRACYDLDFKWGGSDDEALREIEAVRASLQGRLPADSRDRMHINTGRDNGGFLALSFYSNERSLTELHKMLEPALMPKLAKVKDSNEPWLLDPNKRQISIELKPETMATLQLLPNQVASAVLNSLESYGGGSITMESGTLTLEYPRFAADLEMIKQIQIPISGGGRSVHLSDVALVDLTIPIDSMRIAKTSGAASVILYTTPKPGGNVKAMAEDFIKIVNETLKSLPADVQYKSLVDPSEFIRSAVANVAKEVALAAGLAVIILFLFVGNLKNVITAAIEIPLSLVLAFIMMKVSGMNLNLISLGGLALSAGMNVDASVVVMENIFRHFESVEPGRDLTFEERLALIVRAVREVRFAVIASTIASLVVFLPLAFTSELTYAILGDLAKAVVFSHGFSAIVALILVPTIRLHVMKRGMVHEKPSFFEGPLQKLEILYSQALGAFLERPKAKIGSMAGLAVVFLLLTLLAAPKLPREVIGKPDTDSIWFGIMPIGNTMIRQMEAQSDQIEAQIMREFGDKVAYTFRQVNRPNSAWTLLRLKRKKDMNEVVKKLEERFPNTPLMRFIVDPWNPSEMPLPDPPDFKISIRGVDREAINDLARDVEVELQERKLFSRVNVDPGTNRGETLRIRPRIEQWPLLEQGGARLTLAGLADLTRTVTEGRSIVRVDLGGETLDVFLRYPQNYVSTAEEIGALPVGIGGKILPLKALASLSIEKSLPSIRRENGREAYVVSARGDKDDKAKTEDSVKKANELIENWPRISAERKAKLLASNETNSASVSDPAKRAAVAATEQALVPPTLEIEDAKVELNDALKQLTFAVSLSIALIFLTMVFQFGSIMNSLLVLVAVPLGFIGVVASLMIFKSTLSLNSLLGVILLNGLAVANSIILVDFLQRKVREGVAPRLAAVEVARVRLRPILMTSLTTGLGMLPIALGFGEGGQILQPLGIAVAGGLGFSMVTTLFIVPALQVSWLEWRAARTRNANA